MQNLNLLFNKTYYDSLTANDFPGVAAMNERLFNTKFTNAQDYLKPEAMISHSFFLTVCYPGLLIGIGNAHDASLSEDEISIGFSFDYVSGQPYIPGSTVKGILRSHFKDHPQVIAELCEKDLNWVRKLEAEIFDYTDIFFDAVVYHGDKYGKLIGPEYITPHKSATQSPVPNRLLKVLPDVCFSFRFRLLDSPSMTAPEKEALFLRLLCLFGIGAKTNVGYGILQEGAIESHLQPMDPPARVPSPAYTPQREPRKNTAPFEHTRIDCPHCGTRNYKYKPNTREQWPSWPKCHNKDCGKDLL